MNQIKRIQEYKGGRTVTKLDGTYSNWLIEVNNLMRSDTLVWNSPAPSLAMLSGFYRGSLLPKEVLLRLREQVQSKEPIEFLMQQNKTA